MISNFISHKLFKSLFIVLTMISCLQISYAGIFFDAGPGTGAPPQIFKNHIMFPFAADANPIGAAVSSLESPTRCFGTLNFSTPLSHEAIGDGWATWSHGYTGDVYTFVGGTTTTINLPPATRAFYFYTESNNFATYTVNAIANDGTTTGPISINGNSGAKFIGFYTTGSQCLLKSITVTYPPAAGGFAIGEFGISCMAMIPTMSEWGLIILCLLLLAFAGVSIRKRSLAVQGGLTMDVSGSNLSRFPFALKTYLPALFITIVLLTIGLCFAVLGYDYQITYADIPGGIISACIAAYIIHLVMLPKNND